MTGVRPQHLARASGGKSKLWKDLVSGFRGAPKGRLCGCLVMGRGPRNEIEVDGVGEFGAETVGSPKLILIRKSDSSTDLLKQDGGEGSQL